MKAQGCGKIIVSEISGSRQKFCTHFGANVILDPRKEDVVKRVKEETNGEGVDIVFDCAGVAAGLRAACQSIRARGTVVNVAIWEKEVPFQPNDLVFREGNYVACLGYVKQDFKDVIKAIGNGKLVWRPPPTKFGYFSGLCIVPLVWLETALTFCRIHETRRHDYSQGYS